MSDCCSVKDVFPGPRVMNCPVNGAVSRHVDVLTVRSLVRRLPLAMPQTQYYFCGSPDCDVVYFPSDPNAPIFRRDDLLVAVGTKQRQDPIPVCYCFGFTQQEILDELTQTGKSTIAERIRGEVKAGNCACEVKNPSGKCCLGDVSRLYRPR